MGFGKYRLYQGIICISVLVTTYDLLHFIGNNDTIIHIILSYICKFTIE